MIKPNKEGKKKQLLFKVVKRDDCVEELNAKMKRELWDVCCRQILFSWPVNSCLELVFHVIRIIG